MTIGILGGGQLARMLALAGVPLGIRCRVLDPVPGAPASVVAHQVVGEYDDFAALAEFVRGLDAVTYEFENVPVLAADWLAQRVPVYPPPRALEIAQDRLNEKSFFDKLGVPVPAFQPVDQWDDLQRGVAAIGLPAVLKTRRFGYDGKGQLVLRSRDEVAAAWARLGGRPLILEQFVPFDHEVSLLAVRGRDGACAFYPLVENHHRNGILRQSLAPFGDERLWELAVAYARRALTTIDYVGVLAVEFFLQDNRLLVNEMAPRVHNSGHWTIEGAATSQFENHLRAVAGWPLGETRQLGPAAMINLIGTLPDVPAVMAVPGTRVHLYGKAPRPNRKLGHVTVTADDRAELNDRLRFVESALRCSRE